MRIRQEIFVLLALSWLAACAPQRPSDTGLSAAATPVPPTGYPAPVVTSVPATSLPQDACTETQGRVLLETLSDPRRGATFRYHLYLPPCYETSSQRYPVLYLLHGMTYDDTQWLDLGLAQQADALIAAGEIPPLIIVLPYDPSWKLPAEDDFDEFLLERLVPYIDATYRTWPDASHRALGGLSRGGGWAVHLGLQHPELFGVLGWHSPAIFWGDEKHLADWAQAISPEALPQIYLDSGDNDPDLKTTLALESILTAAGLPHEWHLFHGWHENAYWQAHLPAYLRWYGRSLCLCGCLPEQP